MPSIIFKETKAQVRAIEKMFESIEEEIDNKINLIQFELDRHKRINDIKLEYIKRRLKKRYVSN